MSERNPDRQREQRETLAMTALRNIASGAWNCGRGDETLTVEEYAAEAIAAAHFTDETWRCRYFALLDDLDAARRARG